MSKKYILNFLLLTFLTISCTKDQEKATPENQIEESVESTIKKQPKLIPPKTKSPAPPKFSIHEAATGHHAMAYTKESDDRLGYTDSIDWIIYNWIDQGADPKVIAFLNDSRIRYSRNFHPIF